MRLQEKTLQQLLLCVSHITHIEMTGASQSKRFTFKYSLHSDPLHKLKLIKASKHLKHKEHYKSSTYL
jgi:hypothetical protein